MIRKYIRKKPDRKKILKQIGSALGLSSIGSSGYLSLNELKEVLISINLINEKVKELTHANGQTIRDTK